MMLTPLTNTRNDAHCLSWLFADGAGARVSTAILRATSAQKYFTATHITPAAPPNDRPAALVVASNNIFDLQYLHFRHLFVSGPLVDPRPSGRVG